VARVFPELSDPVTPPSREAAVVAAKLEPAEARAKVERIVREGVLRPFDIEAARVLDPRALWVPFWRIDVLLDGLHLDAHGPARHRPAAVMIPARSDFPYVPRLPSLFAAGTPLLSVAEAELETRDVEAAMAGANAEIVDADVTRTQAESRALGLLIHGVSPTHAIHPTFEPRVEGSRFCWYPVYYTSYEYLGEARRRQGEAFFVALSARTGDVLAAAHPSEARAALAKVRRLLSFDRRKPG